MLIMIKMMAATLANSHAPKIVYFVQPTKETACLARTVKSHTLLNVKIPIEIKQ